jgi:hypothetical protein
MQRRVRLSKTCSPQLRSGTILCRQAQRAPHGLAEANGPK